VVILVKEDNKLLILEVVVVMVADLREALGVEEEAQAIQQLL